MTLLWGVDLNTVAQMTSQALHINPKRPLIHERNNFCEVVVDVKELMRYVIQFV